MKITQAVANNIKSHNKAYDIRDNELKGFLIQVNKSGTASYYFAYNKPVGGKTRIRIGAISDLTATQARKIALGYKLRVSQGNDPREEQKAQKLDTQAQRKKTLKYFVEVHYSDYIETHHKQKATSYLYMGYFMEAWGDKKLEDISTKDLDDYRKKRLKQGRTNSTINREMNLLQGMFSKAIEWEVISETPFRTLKPLKVDKKGITRYLSQDEEYTLREALRDRDEQKRNKRESSNQWHKQRGYELHNNFDNYTYVDYLEPAVLLALNTGMRKGELLSLRWSDIDLTQKFVHLKGENTKSSQSRSIPLNNESYSVMAAWKSERFTKDSDYMFTNPVTGEKLKDIKKAWLEVLRMAQIENFRFHDLRHTFASKLAMRNVDLYSIKELLGHSSLEMVQRYAHLSQDYLKKALEALDNQEKPKE